MSSIVGPIRVAVYDALMADSALQAIVGGRIYTTEAPPGTPLPRITISLPSERDASVINAAGNFNACNLNYWGGDDSECEAMHKRADAVLHHKRLTVAGARHATGSLTLLTIDQDPDATRDEGSLMHGIARYESESRI